MSQLPPGFVLDDAPQGAPMPTGPVYGAPPKPDKPDAPDKPNLPAGYEMGPGGVAVRIPGLPDPNDPNAGKPTEGQGKSAGFLLRALQADDAYRAQDIGARTYAGQTLSEYAPDILNTLPEAVGNSPRRQVADSNQNEFVAATLRYESGAAIPPAELNAQKRRYFPVPGDSEQEIANKANLRATAIEALKQSSGPLVADTLAKFQQMPKTGKADDAASFFGDSPDGLVGGVSDTGPRRPGEISSAMPQAQSAGDYVAAGVGDLIQGGVDNTIGLVVNPVGQMMYNAMPGNQGTYDIGKTIRDALELPQGNQTNSAIIQSAAGGFGAAGLAGAASRMVPGMAGNALAQFGRAPLSDMAIGAGAGAGGEAASRYGPVGQAGGTIGGGIAANALLGLASRGRVRGGGSLPPDMNPEVVAAGERQGIPVRLPDAAPSARNRMAAAEASPYAGPVIKRTMEADNAAMGDKVRGLGGEGVPQTQDYTLGQRVQGVGTRYIDATGAKKNRLYTRAEKLAGGATVTPRNADAVLDQNIQELRAAGENSNAAAIKYLEGLRNDIDAGLSIKSIQNIRTNMRGQISGAGLTGTDTERRVGQVIDAINQDLTEQLPKEASAALRAADSFYKERQTFIKGILQPFMGKNRNETMNPEAAGRAFRGMVGSRANYDKLKSFLNEADPQEVEDFRATIAEGLVSGPKGEVGAAALASNIAKVPENIRNLVFGEDGAKALRDIQILAKAKGESRSGLNNSKSGVVTAAKQIGLRSLMSGVFGALVGGGTGAVIAPVVTEAAAALGQARTARLLLNPDFTKLLRNAPETTKPQVINAYFQRMRDAAAKSPVYANDVQAIEQAITQALSRSPVRAAATPTGQQEQDARRVPPQQ